MALWGQVESFQIIDWPFGRELCHIACAVVCIDERLRIDLILFHTVDGAVDGVDRRAAGFEHALDLTNGGVEMFQRDVLDHRATINRVEVTRRQ